MRLLAFLLLLAAAPAWAEWTPLTEGDSVYLYVDKSTIRKRGNIIKFWTMADRKSPKKRPDGREYRSAASLEEYNCEGEQARTIALTLYSQAMGKGEVVGSSNTPYAEWEPVVPGSLGMTMLKFACEE